MEKKVCKDCGEIRPLGDFHKYGRNSDGRMGICKFCRSKKRIENGEKKKYYHNNKEKLNNKSKQRYQDNLEREKEVRSLYRKANREKLIQINKNYRKNNPEKVQESYKKNQHKPAYFRTYGHRLTIEEKPRETSEGYLEVRCKNCKNYFIPRSFEARNRVGVIEGRVADGEYNLYCSDKCRNLCAVYKQKTYPKYYKPYKTNSRPVQGELREIVLERDNYECQICGNSENLICHHLEAVVRNPIESADLDNVITLCERCHREKVHKDVNCSPVHLACA